MINLLSNAVKLTGVGGIEVRVRRDAWTAVVEAGAVQDAFGNTNGSATPELSR